MVKKETVHYGLYTFKKKLKKKIKICFRTRLRRYNNPQRSSLCSAELDSLEPCHGSGPQCPPGSSEATEQVKDLFYVGLVNIFIDFSDLPSQLCLSLSISLTVLIV